jgi:hypothetical protein
MRNEDNCQFPDSPNTGEKEYSGCKEVTQSGPADNRAISASGDAKIQVEECSFMNCALSGSSVYGGVIYCPSGSTVSLSVSTCLFDHCSVTGSNSYGGAIDSDAGGSVKIVYSNFTSCSVEGGGGSIYLYRGSSHDLKNILTEDSTQGYRGAIEIYSPSGDITLDTISIIRGKSTSQINSFYLYSFTCMVYLSNCLGKDGQDSSSSSSWCFQSYSGSWNVSFEYCFFTGNTVGSGAKDVRFNDAIGTRLTNEDNFVETYSQSATPHSYIEGQTWSDSNPDWIPDGDRVYRFFFSFFSFVVERE